MNYEYKCKTCPLQFQTSQRMIDSAFKICPECKNPTLVRIITGGAGFKAVPGGNENHGSLGLIKDKKLPFIDPIVLIELRSKSKE